MPAAPRSPQLPDETERVRPHTRLRLFGLLAVVVLTAALPLAGASAGPVDDGPVDAGPRRSAPAEADTTDATDRTDTGDSTDGANAAEKRAVDAKPDDAPADRPKGATSPSLLTGLGLTTEAHCGPQLSAPDGIEAQTCVLVQGHDTWARTYYRNATGSGLSAVLTLMAPEGRTLQVHCAVGAEDEPGMCETPRGRTQGEPDQYTAVAEYAKGGEGPLLLRSGSNSASPQGD
ncbi:hypothetical protein ABZY90_08270 [Streptomyces sp. NPDC006422]|uniref:hypothetical protein n=1 Tax=unclassified Streptomyces TaxID=2593676 RepID=UPI0033B7F16C